MRSVIVTTAIRYLLPLMFMFSIYILLRGHNDPGGGFVGGLVAAAAFALHGIAAGTDRARKMMRVEPATLIQIGLSMALVSAVVGPLVKGQPFLTAVWGSRVFPAIGKLGTPLLFDLGVYFAVIGVTTLIIFSLAEEG